MSSCALRQASAIHARYMDTLTEDDRRQTEQIHSSWIEFEITRASHHLTTVCADDVEFWPPDAQLVCGHAEVAALLAQLLILFEEIQSRSTKLAYESKHLWQPIENPF